MDSEHALRLTVTQATITSAIVVTIAPNAETPGTYDFSWNGQEGKVYDLVSSTDLSDPRSSWEIWEGNSGILANSQPISILNIPGGGNSKRFFVVVERDP